MPIGKIQAFTLANASVCNAYASWDGLRPDGTVVFMGWQDRFRRNGNFHECNIWRPEYADRQTLGARERSRNVHRLLQTGETALMLVAIARDPSANTRIVEDVVDALFRVALEERAGHVFAIVQARLPLQ